MSKNQKKQPPPQNTPRGVSYEDYAKLHSNFVEVTRMHIETNFAFLRLAETMRKMRETHAGGLVTEAIENQSQVMARQCREIKSLRMEICGLMALQRDNASPNRRVHFLN